MQINFRVLINYFIILFLFFSSTFSWSASEKEGFIPKVSLEDQIKNLITDEITAKSWQINIEKEFNEQKGSLIEIRFTPSTLFNTKLRKILKVNRKKITLVMFSEVESTLFIESPKVNRKTLSLTSIRTSTLLWQWFMTAYQTGTQTVTIRVLLEVDIVVSKVQIKPIQIFSQSYTVVVKPNKISSKNINTNNSTKQLEQNTLQFPKNVKTENKNPIKKEIQSVDSSESKLILFLKTYETWFYILIPMLFVLLIVFNKNILTFYKNMNPRFSDLASKGTESILNSAGIFSASEIGVSDSAIKNVKDDLIGTSYLSKGLSLFFCHKKTESPLTLAITGSWGSGKSSIMGMLFNYMKQARYYPVWFNAWHHQDEEHFFGALLENIRNDGVPAFWTFSGMVFRARLVVIRLWREKIILLSLIILILFIVFPDKMLPLLLIDATTLTDLEKNGTRAIATIIVLVNFIDKYSAFGFSRKDIIKGVMSSFKTVNLKVDSGLRYKVRQSLQDIDNALGRQTMVLFIDDLDRCPANHVLKVLEVVNFLSAEPLKFFIIFGISLDRVIPIISPTFSKQVEEEYPNKDNLDDKEYKAFLHEKRTKLATQYLQKMFNIEVSVPAANEKDLQKLIHTDRKKIQHIVTPQDKANRVIRLFDEFVYPVGIVVLIFVFLKPVIINTEVAITNSVNVNANVSTLDTNTNSNNQNTNINNLTDNKKIKVEPADFNLKVSSNRYKDSQSILYVLLSLFLTTWFAILYSRKIAAIKDTSTFTKALEIWTPVICIEKVTPRLYIRFINQLRLLSLRMRVTKSLDQNSNKINADKLSKTDESEMIQLTVLFALHTMKLSVDDLADILDTVYIEIKSKNKTDVKVENILKQLLLNIGKNKITEIKISEHTINILAEALLNHVINFNIQWPSNDKKDKFNDFMRDIRLT